MTDPTRPEDPTTAAPPLDLDAIERRLATRTPEQAAARQARLDTWLLGRDAMTIAEHHLTAGDLDRAYEFFTIAARHHAPDAQTMIHTVTTLIDAANDPDITTITADTILETDPVDTHAERDLTIQRANDLTHQLDELQTHVDRVIAEAEVKAADIVSKAHAAGPTPHTREDLYEGSRLITPNRSPLTWGGRGGGGERKVDVRKRMRESSEALQTFQTVQEALVKTYGNVVHGDINPANILFDGDGTFHLIDLAHIDSVVWSNGGVGTYGARAYYPARDLVGTPVEQRDVLTAIRVLNLWLNQFTPHDRSKALDQLDALLERPESTHLPRQGSLLLPQSLTQVDHQRMVVAVNSAR